MINISINYTLSAIKKDLLEVILREHRFKLNEVFEESEANIERLASIARVFNERLQILCDKGNELYTQMCEMRKAGYYENFSDFSIEIKISALSDFAVDEPGNNHGKMAEILDFNHDDPAGYCIDFGK